jgi:hypothetical protein
MDIRIENGFDQSQDLKEFPSIYPKYGTLNHDSACNTSLGFRDKLTPFPSTQAAFKNAIGKPS